MTTERSRVYVRVLLQASLALLFAILPVITAWVPVAQAARPGAPVAQDPVPGSQPDQPDLPRKQYLPMMTNDMLPAVSTIFGVEGETLSLPKMLAARVSWLRMTNMGIRWINVEPQEGQRNWDAMAKTEAVLRQAAVNGAEPILAIYGTPEWAQASPGVACGPIKPEKLAAFGKFVRDTVKRYSASPFNVKYWEIWNEPEIATGAIPGAMYGCLGDPSDPYFGGGRYAEMLKVVYPVIKAVNPKAQVLFGGLLLDCDVVNPVNGRDCSSSKFLEGALRNGGGAFFDGVSFHAYDYYGGQVGVYANPNWHSAWNTTGPVLTAKAEFLKSVLAQYDVPDKYLMNTELALICDKCGTDPVFQEAKAQYLAQSYAAATAEGLKANIWFHTYTWRGSDLMTKQGQTHPAYDALRFGRRELRDARYVGPVNQYEGIMGYEFRRDHTRLWVVWALDGSSHTLQLPTRPVAVYDALGVAKTPRIQVTVDGTLCYIEWKE